MPLKMTPIALAAPAVVLLDLDGTAYPFDHAYRKACLAALAKVTRYAVAARFNGELDKARDFVAAHGVHDTRTPHDIAKLVERSRRELEPAFIQPAPALAQKLKAIRLPVYTVSNSSPSWIDAALEHRGLSEVVPQAHRISTRRHLGASKVYAQTYTSLLTRLQIVEPSKVLLIDDESENLLAASGAGMMTGLIRKDKTPVPDYVTASANNLADLLHHFFPQPAPGTKPQP